MKLIKWLLKRKLLLAVLAVVFVGGGYYFYRLKTGKKDGPRYTTARVFKGALIVSVSGSGQISVSNQIDIKPKTAAEIVFVGAGNGQDVKAGALLFSLNSKEALKAVRDAQTNLESARLSFDKLKAPVDKLALLQAQNALTQARETNSKAEAFLKKAYEDGFNSVANAFLDLPEIISGLQDILYSSDKELGGSAGQANLDYYSDAVKNYDGRAEKYRDDADVAFKTAQKAYDKSFSDYKTASRFSSEAVIEELISQTYNSTKLTAEAVKNATNLVQFYKDILIARNVKPKALADAHIISLGGHTAKTNSHLLNLFAIVSALSDSKQTIAESARAIEERRQALEKLEKGAEPLDIRAQELAVKQRENALADAREKLADYFAYAPMDGVVAKVNVKKGDAASLSSSLATLIAKQKIAEISLNEVDVTKVKIGQKANLSFDAIEELNITGTVGEIDSLGTTSQGVVSYGVKIIFDTQDARVKPGMTVSAAIITDVKQDVLMVQNSAVKSGSSQGAFVEVLKDGKPLAQAVETGLSSDSLTEIISGLAEGEEIITQTILPSSVQSQTSGQARVGIPGLGGFGGGAFRGR